MMRIVYALLAAGTAHSNSTAETVLASTGTAVIANHLQVGKVYRLRAAVIATATNSTDTLNVKVRVGGTTLTGTVVSASGAVDAANNDVVVVDIEFIVRSIGATGVVIAYGYTSTVGAEGTASARAAFESLSLDTTAALLFEVTGTWSVASASNSCRCDALTLSELS